MNHVGLYGKIVEELVTLEEDDEGSQVNFTVSNLRRVGADDRELTYVPVRTYDWLAEVVSMNAKKGDFVLVEGKLATLDGEEGSALGIEANRVMFLDQRRLAFPETSWQDRSRNRG